MAKPIMQALRERLLGETVQLNLNGSLPEESSTSELTSLNLEQPVITPKLETKTYPVHKAVDPNAAGFAIIDQGGTKAYSTLLQQTNVDLFRNYAKYSTWVRAAIDYHRRMLGRASFEIIQIDSTAKPTRVDKRVKAETENLLRHPNAADESYGTIKEQWIEDYLVIGHGVAELDLRRDLTPMSIRILDAAKIGFVRDWDGTDRTTPRFCEFTDKNGGTIKRYLAHEQVLCMVNRPMSDTKLGLSHVAILHRTVLALLSGEEWLIKQLLQPMPDSMLSLGEGTTKQQADDFKYQIQQVRDKLVVIGGAKDPKVLRLSGTAEEMKILDGQEWYVRQVAAVFGMSTAKLKLAVDLSRANGETMMDDDLEMITGELTRIEELETATFINRYSYMGEINLKFSYPIMQRKDEKQQADIAKTQTGQAWTSINEARTRTGEKPLEGKDFPYADEPILNMGKGGIPLPYSVWAKKVQEEEKNIGKVPEEAQTDSPPPDAAVEAPPAENSNNK